MRRASGEEKTRRPTSASRPPGPTGTAGIRVAWSCCVVTTLGYQNPGQLAGALVVGAMLGGGILVSTGNVVVDGLGKDFGLFGVHPVSGIADLNLSGDRKELAHRDFGFIVDVVGVLTFDPQHRMVIESFLDLGETNDRRQGIVEHLQIRLPNKASLTIAHKVL